MSKFESSVKQISYSQERVYNKLSNLSNLQGVKERFEAVKSQMNDKIEDVDFDNDSITFTVKGMKLTLRIVEREPMKCIKFEGDHTPIPLQLWIQMLPVTNETSKLRVTINADVNIFMKAMVNKPLKEGVEKIADMLAMISY